MPTETAGIRVLIIKHIKKATKGGGFHSLSQTDAHELSSISLLAEQYEDNVSKIMPLPITINSVVQNKINELNMLNRAQILHFAVISAY